MTFALIYAHGRPNSNGSLHLALPGASARIFGAEVVCAGVSSLFGKLLALVASNLCQITIGCFVQPMSPPSRRHKFRLAWINAP